MFSRRRFALTMFAFVYTLCSVIKRNKKSVYEFPDNPCNFCGSHQIPAYFFAILFAHVPSLLCIRRMACARTYCVFVLGKEKLNGILRSERKYFFFGSDILIRPIGSFPFVLELFFAYNIMLWVYNGFFIGARTKGVKLS